MEPSIVTANSKQAAAEQKYSELRQAVEKAGYFAPHVQILGIWDRLTCTSKYRRGYTGIILFIMEKGGHWYINTPHPDCFRVRDSTRIAQVVIAWLSLDSKKKASRNPDEVDLEKELVKIEGEELERVLLGG